MPTVEFRGEQLECEEGAVLRDVLLNAGLSPHNRTSEWVNCRGHATCGTCAVEVRGAVSEIGDDERHRLSLPPHSLDSGLRLSCQTDVLGDVTVVKHRGFWGQDIERDGRRERPASEP